MANRWGNSCNSVRLYFLGCSKITADGDCSQKVFKKFAPRKKSYDQPRQHVKKQRHYFANKVVSNRSYSFSSSHVWMWELDYKDSWVLKNQCFWTVVLEKTLEHSLDCKEIQPVLPKGNQSWTFIGRTDAEAEAPILWPSDSKNWPFVKDPIVGKDWRQEEKGTTEDEMVGWYHWLDGHEWSNFWELPMDRRPGVLLSTGSQRVGCDSVTEPNWTEKFINQCEFILCKLTFPGGSDGTESTCKLGDTGSISGSGRYPGDGNGSSLRYSCLKDSMDRRAW